MWTAGITDSARPGLLAAKVEAKLDGVALGDQWLEYRGRVGNDSRYRFTLPRDVLYYGAKWSTLTYTLAFSTDVGRTAEAIRALSAKDAAAYPDFCATLQRLGGFLGGLLEMTPPDIDAPATGEMWELLKTGRRWRTLLRRAAPIRRSPWMLGSRRRGSWN